MRKLDIITSNSGGDIFISNNGDISFLNYLDESGNQVCVSNESSLRRPLRVSELESKLSKRRWNNVLTRGITNEGNVCIDGVSFYEFNDISDKEKESFREDEEYKNILERMKKNEIYFYNSSERTVDLLENSIIIDAVLYSSNDYTNILSLRELITLYPYSGKGDLSIQYSKEGKVFNSDLSFEIYNSDKSSGFIKEINNDVTVEYFEGVLRLIPMDQEVDECIISNCYITYGNINK